MVIIESESSTDDGRQRLGSEEIALRASDTGINGKNVWRIRMFGTPAGADKEWVGRTQAYVKLTRNICVHVCCFHLHFYVWTYFLKLNYFACYKSKTTAPLRRKKN